MLQREEYGVTKPDPRDQPASGATTGTLSQKYIRTMRILMASIALKSIQIRICNFTE